METPEGLSVEARVTAYPQPFTAAPSPSSGGSALGVRRRARHSTTRGALLAGELAAFNRTKRVVTTCGAQRREYAPACRSSSGRP
jgi:hypothetical protein